MERHKKLIEVALPLAAINKETAREKSYGMDIRRRCICGGPGGRWRHVEPWCSHPWSDDPDSDPAYRRSDGSVDEERADELGSGVRKLMKYGKAYGGSDPELVEGDVFRSIVKYPDFEVRQIDSTELRPELGAQSGSILQALCERHLSANELTEILGIEEQNRSL